MKISTLGGHFPKMDIYKCPILKTGGRLLKKAMHSSLRA
jgi:hypothetical protein